MTVPRMSLEKNFIDWIPGMADNSLTATFKIALMRFRQRSLPTDSKEFTELQLEILKLQDQIQNWHN